MQVLTRWLKWTWVGCHLIIFLLICFINILCESILNKMVGRKVIYSKGGKDIEDEILEKQREVKND